MKKEATIIVTAEFTKIHADASFGNKPIEEVKEMIKQQTKAKFEGLGLDNINITNVQVFELEKEERISTEDLIKAARVCSSSERCKDCPISTRCVPIVPALADRLEELHNQQKPTPIEEQNCSNCKYRYVSPSENPCCRCIRHNGNQNMWERA